MLNTQTNSPQVVTVSEITHAIKNTLERTFRSVYIQGEISNFKQQSSGHLYFSLKDTGAQISAAMFRGNASTLTSLPRDGDHVIVRGEINVYPPRGQYQVIVREIHFVGLGELLVRFEQLKQALQLRGWFDPAHKKPLPRFPRRIGIITSPTGAALQDILNVLGRRHGGVDLLLNPVRVQGAEAPAEIAAAIQQMNQYKLVDVMIIGRGGGSIEDLWAFNEEIVARAIFESGIPIISAVGHETDHSIADYVADVRAPTPSAAAEIVIAEKAQMLAFLESAQMRALQTVTYLIDRVRQQLKRYQSHPLFTSPYALLGRAMQQCDDLRLSIDRQMRALIAQQKVKLLGARQRAIALRPTARVAHYRSRLQALGRNIDQTLFHTLKRRRERLEGLKDHLAAVDPRTLLKQGYSILRHKEGVISSTKTLEPGQKISALLADGTLELNIEKVSPHE